MSEHLNGTEHEPDSATMPVGDAFNEAPVDYEESNDFPVLQGILLTYFPRTDSHGRKVRADNQSEFLDRYARDGEAAAEFAGLAEELRSAVRHPKSATPVVNEALGTDIPPMEMRRYLAELLDQITQSGQFDPEPAEQDAEEDARSQREPTPEELLDHYFRRKVRLPWGPESLTRYRVPLWSVLLSGFAIGGAGLGLSQFEAPSWIGWFPYSLIALGFVIIAVSSTAMRGLREELKAPEREARRERAKAEAQASKERRQAERSKWRRFMAP